MWGREMRAGLAFVVVALLIGGAFREWRRTHEDRFADLVRGLMSREVLLSEGAVAPGESPGPDSARGGTAPVPVRRTSTWVPVGRIDPNRATAGELERLPGIGPSLAGRIIADRTSRGAFAAPEALLRVPGIGPKILDRIRAYLVFPAPAEGDSLNRF
jgi:competence ComEA-like helix-hairpin-helix protein